MDTEWTDVHNVHICTIVRVSFTFSRIFRRFLMNFYWKNITAWNIGWYMSFCQSYFTQKIWLLAMFKFGKKLHFSRKPKATTTKLNRISFNNSRNRQIHTFLMNVTVIRKDTKRSLMTCLLNILMNWCVRLFYPKIKGYLIPDILKMTWDRRKTCCCQLIGETADPTAKARNEQQGEDDAFSLQVRVFEE